MRRRLSRELGTHRGPTPWWKSRGVWARVLGVGFLLAGFDVYVGQLVPQQLSLPLVPLVLDPMQEPSDSLPLARGALAGRSVLLVTIDTARPDRLGFYGNSDIATPNLDRLARGSSVFTRALATTPVTLPSHASILTGKYPHHHGVRLNGLPPLAPNQETLAEHLSQQGYDTAAFVSSFILEAQFGLDQGFGSRRREPQQVNLNKHNRIMLVGIFLEKRG